jgi:hypothetical protein
LCHNAKVVHAFEANTPSEKLPNTQINVPRLISINARGAAAARFPRFRALALFGRRPPQRVDSLVMPASENLHNNGSARLIRSPRRTAQNAPSGAVIRSLRAAVPRWHEIARGTRERKQLAEKRRR